MESSFLSAVFLPLALFVIMLGMGLGLKLADFKRVAVEPKAVLTGLLAQLAILPLVGWLIAVVAKMPPELAVGIMVLAACPGGPTSNLITYLARGDVALSISLTALNSLITVITIPLIVNLASEHFVGEGSELSLPFVKTVIQIGVITIIPVSLGMWLRAAKPALAAKLEQKVKWLSVAFLGLIIVGLLIQERANVPGFFVQVGWTTLALNLITMAAGFGLAVLLGVGRARTTAITVEVGIQNGTLAIAVASSPLMLANPTVAIPAVFYSLLMFLTGGVFAWLRSGKSD
jgi:BASS family bile acid:Na+ symporter